MRNGDTTQPEYYFAYNHKRERTVRSIRNNGASWSANAIQYVYDEESHLIGEYKSNGTPIVEYVWKGDVPVAAIYGTTSATKIYYIVADAQNTPRRLIDSSNNAVVWAWDSTAFGVAPPSIETVKFNLRFPGQYYDEITKQHYNLNRYYNPEIGRYMEADPIGLEGGLNPYVYAGNSPIMISDQSGLCPIMINGLCLAGSFDISKPETYNHLSASYTPAPTGFNHPKGYTDHGASANNNNSGGYGSLSDSNLSNIYAFGLTKDQCSAMCNLIAKDDSSSSPLGVLYSSQYHSLSVKDDILALDAPYPSIVGDVSADWMLRSSVFGFGVIPHFSEASYMYAKWGWNIVNGASYDASIGSPKNINAPGAASLWLQQGVPLRSIFAPSVKQCGCK